MNFYSPLIIIIGKQNNLVKRKGHFHSIWMAFCCGEDWRRLAVRIQPAGAIQDVYGFCRHRRYSIDLKKQKWKNINSIGCEWMEKREMRFTH